MRAKKVEATGSLNQVIVARMLETQAEGEAGFLQGAQYGTRFQIQGSSPELKANTQLLIHPGIPKITLKIYSKGYIAGAYHHPIWRQPESSSFKIPKSL